MPGRVAGRATGHGCFCDSVVAPGGPRRRIGGLSGFGPWGGSPHGGGHSAGRAYAARFSSVNGGRPFSSCWP